MPNAQGHDAITHIVAASTGIAAGALYGWRVGLVAGAACWLSGWMLSPDLDLNSAPSNRWGPLEFVWWPYRTLADHRGFSHWPVIGVATRLLYLYGMLVLLAAVASWFYRWPWLQGFDRTMQSAQTAVPEIPASVLNVFIWTWDAVNIARNGSATLVIAGIVGAEIGAESHIIADLIYSAWKKWHPEQPARKRKAAAGKRELRKAA